MACFSIQTIIALVELATGGPGLGQRSSIGKYRTGPELEMLLGHCGIDLNIGLQSRIPAVRSALSRENEAGNLTSLSKLIEVIADRREYPSNPQQHEEIIHMLQENLAADGFELQRVAGKFVLCNIGQSETPTVPQYDTLKQQKAASVAERELTDTERENDSKKAEQGTLKPKPPVILQNIQWVLMHGQKHWKLLVLAVSVISIFYYVLPYFIAGKNQNQHLETKTNGTSSPAIITSGPNSHVIISYDSSRPEKGSSSSQNHLKENKLQVTLRNICKDIDSRPLTQQDETAKQYFGMSIKKERLRVRTIEIADGNTYALRLKFPDEPNFPNSKWTILSTVSKEHYPQLRLAREDTEFYVSGEIEDTFRTFGEPYIDLSNATLEFE